MKMLRLADVSGELVSIIIQDRQLELIQGNIFNYWKPSGIKLEFKRNHFLSPADHHDIRYFGKNFCSPPCEENAKIPKVPLFFIKPSASEIAGGQNSIFAVTASDEAYCKPDLTVTCIDALANPVVMEPEETLTI